MTPSLPKNGEAPAAHQARLAWSPSDPETGSGFAAVIPLDVVARQKDTLAATRLSANSGISVASVLLGMTNTTSPVIGEIGERPPAANAERQKAATRIAQMKRCA
jgi:hypothetical protein